MLGHIFRLTRSLLREHVMKAVRRSKDWKSVRDKVVKGNPFCIACGSSSHLQVHHKEPFHLDPAKELDVTNLIVLCMGENECHYFIGHSATWQGFNPNVEQDALEFKMHPDRKQTIFKRAVTNRQFTEIP